MLMGVDDLKFYRISTTDKTQTIFFYLDTYSVGECSNILSIFNFIASNHDFSNYELFYSISLKEEIQ